jgi:hypothetical protein
MNWDWVLQALGFSPLSWINIHAGHDESSDALQRIFKDGARTRLRHLRARRDDRAVDCHARGRPRRTPPPPPSTWTIGICRARPAPIDAAMLLLSAHELRSDAAAGALFTELRRVLGPGGRVVVAEHLRDWANFLAYGPGFLHFHSRRTWVRCFARHRFDVHAEFSITPFVRVFVLRRLT